MNRCSLCGGPIGSDGRCRECGLDNTKNDKKYRLNTHNDKVTMLHHGDCEDNLNKDHGWGSSVNAKKREKTISTGKKNDSGAVSSGSSRSELKKKSDKAANAAQTIYKTEKRNSRKQRERNAAGTVKKKGNCLTKIVKWIVIFYILQFVLAAIFGAMNTADFSEDWFVQILEDLELNEAAEIIREYQIPDPETYVEEAVPVEVMQEEEADEISEAAVQLPAEWDKSEAGYLEQEVTTGIYTVGYDIPAGTYQVTCPEGTAWLYWNKNPEDYSHFACLYSEEEQQLYAEYSEEGECPYNAYSELLTLEEGGMIYVEDCMKPLLLCGNGEGTESLKERQAQNLPGTVPFEDGMTAGTDFTPGVYDIVLQEGEFGVSVNIYKSENDSTYYIYLLEDRDTFYRFPLSEGDTIEVETYGERCTLQLEPSY